MPRQVLKKQRIILSRTISIHTLDSSSTLVEVTLAAQVNTDSQDQSKSSQNVYCLTRLIIVVHSARDITSKCQKLGNAFVKFSAPIMTPSHSIKPFARRLSLPARRLSESFAIAVATPFRTHVAAVEAPSYFTDSFVASEPSPLYSECHTGQVDAVVTESVSEELVVVAEDGKITEQATKKSTKIKRVTRKMKSLLYRRQHSTILRS
jgi:hypothetical protein